MLIIENDIEKKIYSKLTPQDLADHQNCPIGQTILKAFIFEKEEKIKLHPSTMRRQLSAMGLKGCVAERSSY